MDNELKTNTFILVNKFCKDRQSWKKWNECSSRPDVSNEDEINTFISTWKEEISLEPKLCIQTNQFSQEVIHDMLPIIGEYLSKGDIDKHKY